MKTASLLSRASAAVSALTLTLALFGGSHAVTFFAVSAVAFVTLIAARDYAPRTRRWQPSVTSRTSAARRDHRFQLAA